MKINNPEDSVSNQEDSEKIENSNYIYNPEDQKPSGGNGWIKKIVFTVLLLLAVLVTLYFLAVWYVSKEDKNPHQENMVTLEQNEPICKDLIGKAYVQGKEDKPLEVFIACTAEDKTKGFKGFLEINENSGMAFFFEKAKPYKFWMKDTSMYLSAAFLDENKKIIGIYDLEPLTETKVGPNSNSKYVIETNKGWFEKNNIKIGDTFIFDRIPQDSPGITQKETAPTKETVSETHVNQDNQKEEDSLLK